MPNAECRMPITFAFLSPLCSLTNSQLVDVSQFLTFCFLLVSQLTCLQTRWLSSLQISWGGVHGIVHFWLVHFLLDSKIADSMYPSSWICTFTSSSSAVHWLLTDSQIPIPNCRMPNADCSWLADFDSADFSKLVDFILTLSSMTSPTFSSCFIQKKESHHFHQRLSSGFGVWELNDEEFKVVGWRRRPSQSQEDSAFGIRHSAFGIRQSVKRQKTSWRGRVNELSRQLEKQSGRWMSNFEVQSQSPKFSSSISDFCIFPQKRTFWVHELTSSKKSLSTHWLPAAKLLVIDDWLLNSARQLGKPWLSQLSKLGIRTQDFFTDLKVSVKSVSL